MVTTAPTPSVPNTANDMRTLRGFAQAAADVLLSRRAKAQKIRRDQMISLLAQKQQLDATNAAALAALDALYQGAEAARDALRATADAVFAPAATTQDRILQQLSDQQLWRRLTLQLNAGASEQDLIREAAAAGDLASLRVLRAELPSVISARYRNSDDRQVAAVTLAGDLQVLDQLETPLLPPAQQAARRLQEDLTRGWYFVDMAYNFARDELEGGGQKSVLATWDGGSITVGDIGRPEMAAAGGS